LGALEAAGFTITRLDRFFFPESKFTSPASPCILGTAKPLAGLTPSSL